MHDTTAVHPNDRLLFEIAASQRGYFTSRQARDAGYSYSLLAYHARSGRFLRVRHGLYRLRDFPASMHEETLAAWLAAGKDVAVVSHESALELLELSDIIPAAIHLTVPRSRRYLRPAADTVIHTTVNPLTNADVVVREGIRVTNPERSIVDAAGAGSGGEQIVMAVLQAFDQGLSTPNRLRRAAEGRDERVRALIDLALETAAS